MAGPVIAFLESARQAEAALSLSPRPDLFLPLAPTAAARLESAGIAYTKAESLYDECEVGTLSDKILDAEASWVDWLDDWIQERIPAIKDAGLRPALLHFFRLKTMFDALHLRALVLRRIFEATKPSKAVYFNDGHPLQPGADLAFSESLNSLCLPHWSRATGVGIERFPATGDECYARPAYRRRLNGALLSRSWRKLSRRAAELIRSSRSSGPRLLIREGYDIDAMLPELVRRDISLLRWSGFKPLLKTEDAIASSLAASWYALTSHERWNELMRPYGIDLAPIAEGRLAFWWNTVIPETWAAFQGARREFRRRGVGGVLVPFAETHQDVAILRAARAENLPVFIFQHGGFAGTCEYTAWEFADLVQADTMLFYGKGTADHYAERSKRYSMPRAKSVPVGSTRLDALAVRPRDSERLRARLNAGRDPQSPLALYFPARHAGYARYLCCDEMPDVSHWELQRDIIRCFQDFPGVRLIYRPYVGCLESPAPHFLRRELPSAVVESDASLPDLLWAVDVIITDMPSTGLLEAVLTDRPVLAYSDGRSIRMRPEARELLLKRASVDHAPEDFLARIRGFLSAADFSPLPAPDREFIRAYATHFDDGRSAERAADIVATRLRV